MGFDVSGSTDTQQKIEFEMLQKVGDTPARKTDVMLALDTVNQQLQVKVGTEGRVYEINVSKPKHCWQPRHFALQLLALQGQLQHQQQRGLQCHVLKDGQQFAQVDAQLDMDTPHFTSSMIYEDRKVAFYGGLKEANVILFSVSGTDKDTQGDVEDIKVVIELSPSGQVLKAELDWRPEMFDEAKMELIRYQQSVVRSSLSTGIYNDLGAVKTALKASGGEILAHLQESLEMDADYYMLSAGLMRENIMSLYMTKIGFVQDSFDYLTATGITFTYRRLVLVEFLSRSQRLTGSARVPP